MLPSGGVCRWVDILNGDPDPDSADKPTIVSLLGVLCVEDGLKEEGELSSETVSSSCPALLAPSRLFYDWTQPPRLHPYFCEKMNPSLFSLRPRKKQVNSRQLRVSLRFLVIFNSRFGAPTRLLRETTRHAPIPFRR